MIGGTGCAHGAHIGRVSTRTSRSMPLAVAGAEIWTVFAVASTAVILAPAGMPAPKILTPYLNPSVLVSVFEDVAAGRHRAGRRHRHRALGALLNAGHAHRKLLWVFVGDRRARERQTIARVAPHRHLVIRRVDRPRRCSCRPRRARLAVDLVGHPPRDAAPAAARRSRTQLHTSPPTSPPMLSRWATSHFAAAAHRPRGHSRVRAQGDRRVDAHAKRDHAAAQASATLRAAARTAHAYAALKPLASGWPGGT